MLNETTTPWNHEVGNLEGASGVDLNALEEKTTSFVRKTFIASDEDIAIGKTGGKMSEATEAMENEFSKRELAILATQMAYEKAGEVASKSDLQDLINSVLGKN